MHVVFDHHAFCLQRIGGISRYFCELGLELSRHEGVDVSVHAPIHRNILLANSPLGRGLRFVEAPQEAYVPMVTAGVALALRMHQPRRAIVHETFYAFVRENVVKGPRATTVHDMIHERFRSQFSRADTTALRKKRSIDRCDLVLCVSETTRRDLLEAHPRIDPARVAVVHHGCTLAERATLDPSLISQPFVLYVGARAGYKNWDRFLASVAASARCQRALRVVAFGGGPLTSEEKQRARALGFDERSLIQQGGDDSTLAALYASARATVVPSLYEGFGLPVIEAMSAGCPVAIADRGALPEVADDAALAFDPERIDAMSSAIERVCFDEPLRAQLIERGARRATHFTWKRCADETLARYKALWG